MQVAISVYLGVSPAAALWEKQYTRLRKPVHQPIAQRVSAWHNGNEGPELQMQRQK